MKDVGKKERKYISSSEFKAIFDALPDGVIICDSKGSISKIDLAALKLFEVASEGLCLGTSYRQFLHAHKGGTAPPSLEPWLLSLVTNGDIPTGQREDLIVLRLPSGQQTYASMRSSPLVDAQKRVKGTLYMLQDITHRYQQALHIQRVHQVVMALKEAIMHIPEQVDCAFEEGIFLLSPPVLVVSQQLVEVIHEVLDCARASLLAIGPGTGHLYYVVGSGFTPEQELYRYNVRGCFLPSDFVDETVIDRLNANQEVILPGASLHLPAEMQKDFVSSVCLLIPFFLEDRLAGALVIEKMGVDSVFTASEIELVKAVASETLLVIDYLCCFAMPVENSLKARAQQEMQHLIDDFLNLASHELRTPLAIIKGNIQLAQRRLARLKQELIMQSGQVSSSLRKVQAPLEAAVVAVSAQERAMNDLIDVFRIQSNNLELQLQHYNLVVLLQEVVTVQQRLAPEQPIMLQIPSEEYGVPVLVDAKRIRQVISNYLANALNYSPVDEPVIVQLTVKDGVAQVSVQDRGPGIPIEEQGRIWERFYYVKRGTGQYSPVVSVGSGLYLSKALIERQHGSVGMQSSPGHGTTFWFTLPVVSSVAE
ncbi:MAG TPA: ATP-binding protein [Ktedonobacteraceae bacterium]|nr:ATP-binding protein [Ktedonobacteraceae bacterium]